MRAGRPTRQVVAKPKPRTTPTPPPDEPRLQQIHALLTPLGLTAIERHGDSGAWMAVFPFKLTGYDSSEQLGTAVYALVRDWAAPTPFGAGRLFKPDRWFVSFSLR